MPKVSRKVLKVVSGGVVAGALIAITVVAVVGGGPAHAGSLPNLTGAAANEPAAKQSILQAQSAQADSAPKADKSTLVPITNQPGTVPTGGILNVPQGPFPYDVFAVKNSWGGDIGGQWLWVYAGQVGPENQASGPYGGVALFSQTLSGLDYGTGVKSLGYVTVSGLTGPLHITSVTGNTMNLNDVQGNVYTFDLSGLKFSAN